MQWWVRIPKAQPHLTVPMNAYDWIIFDSTGTLMTPDPEPACIYQATARRLGSRLDVEQIRVNLRAALVRHFFGDTSGQPTDEDAELLRWRRIVADALPDLRGDQLRHAFDSLWNHFASAETWRLYDDVLGTLDRLKSEGYLIAVASNFDARLQSILSGMKIQDRFDDVLISSKLGWSKPNTQFYDAAAIRLCAADRSRLLMIGDTHRGDVLAAQAAGWNARHLVRDHDGALSNLTSDL